MLEPYIDSARVLDLFSGTGALGVEALSRGAEWVDFFESDARQCSAIKDNLKFLDYDDFGHVHRAQAERAVSMLEGSYDVILIDPPYAYDKLEPLLEEIGESSLSRAGSIIAVEHSHRQDLPLEVDGLRLIKQRRYGETMVTVYQQGGE
jgi:16S rRNA (guanine966-N2)-methyltransferase